MRARAQVGGNYAKCCVKATSCSAAASWLVYVKEDLQMKVALWQRRVLLRNYGKHQPDALIMQRFMFMLTQVAPYST